jgi:N-acetylglucosaminyldiphosphoundecaprenol N-acetyl-beta-D-mannosaminyltransferase
VLGKGRAAERAERRGRALRARTVGVSSVPEVELAGVRLHALSEAGCIAHVVAALVSGRGGWIVTPNLDHLRRIVREPGYAALCAEADLRVADGMPLVWASRLQRTPLPGRVAGSHLVSSLTAALAREGRSIYLLGGDEGTAEGAARVLRARHPELVVAGTDCPPPGFEGDEARLRRMREELAAAAPDVVYVALGSPKQERLIRDLRAVLPGAWWVGVGISFSFLTGDVRRAPAWMQRSGLEWVHRLVQEPRRLARRYLVDGLPFAIRLLAGSTWRGLTSARGTPPSAPRGDPSGTGAR